MKPTIQERTQGKPCSEELDAAIESFRHLSSVNIRDTKAVYIAALALEYETIEQTLKFARAMMGEYEQRQSEEVVIAERLAKKENGITVEELERRLEECDV